MLLLKWCPIFDSSPIINFFWGCWFLCKNLSNFGPPLENSTTRITILPVHSRPYWQRKTYTKYEIHPSLSANVSIIDIIFVVNPMCTHSKVCTIIVLMKHFFSVYLKIFIRHNFNKPIEYKWDRLKGDRLKVA